MDFNVPISQKPVSRWGWERLVTPFDLRDFARSRLVGGLLLCGATSRSLAALGHFHTYFFSTNGGHGKWVMRNKQF